MYLKQNTAVTWLRTKIHLQATAPNSTHASSIYLSLTGGTRGLFVFLPAVPSPPLLASSEFDLRWFPLLPHAVLSLDLLQTKHRPVKNRIKILNAELRQKRKNTVQGDTVLQVDCTLPPLTWDDYTRAWSHEPSEQWKQL